MRFGGTRRTSWRRGPVVALVAVMAAALSGCQMYLVANTDSGAPDGPVVVVAPADHSQLAADFTTMPVEIDASGVDPDDLRVYFETGSQTVFATITGLFERSGDTWTAALPRQIFLPGVTYITAEVVPADAERITRRVAVSWEPAIDVADAGRCETLGQARCLLPFPSDAYTVEDPATDTGRRVALDVASMPANVGGTPIDPTELNRNDGFSPGALIMAEVPGLDLTRTDEPRIDDLGRALRPDSPVMVIDADTRERIPVFAEIDQARITATTTPLLLVRPVRNLEEGHRYVVGLRNLRRSDGSLIEPDRAFRVYRDNIPTFIPEVEARRPAMFQNLTVLAEAGMVLEDIHLAWDFTVASRRSLTERSLSIRDQTFDALGATGTPDFTIDAVVEAPNADTLRRIRGHFTAPNFLTGDGSPGNAFHYDDPTDPDALPAPIGTYEANFICNIPRAAVGSDGTAVPGRSLIYGHGLLSDASEVNGFAGLGNRYNYTMCATDWIGMATEDLPNVIAVLGDLSGFDTMADRMQQGILNFQILGRLLNSVEGFATDPAFRVGSDDRAAFRPDSLVFNGNSQGGIMGGALTALSNEFERAVLGVPGTNYSTLLSRSINYDPFSAINSVAYPDPFDQTFGQALIQMLWDRGESNGYAHHVTEDPLPGTRSHEVLLIEAFGDHQVTNIATENQARTYGVATPMPNLTPGRSWDTTPMWGIERITSFPHTGSALIEWDFPYATGAPPIVNLPNRVGKDPHGLGAREPRLGIQVAYFFEGLVVDVCRGPCVSDVR